MTSSRNLDNVVQIVDVWAMVMRAEVVLCFSLAAIFPNNNRVIDTNNKLINQY